MQSREIQVVALFIFHALIISFDSPLLWLIVIFLISNIWITQISTQTQMKFLRFLTLYIFIFYL